MRPVQGIHCRQRLIISTTMTIPVLSTIRAGTTMKVWMSTPTCIRPLTASRRIIRSRLSCANTCTPWETAAADLQTTGRRSAATASSRAALSGTGLTRRSIRLWWKTASGTARRRTGDMTETGTQEISLPGNQATVTSARTVLSLQTVPSSRKLLR